MCADRCFQRDLITLLETNLFKRTAGQDQPPNPENLLKGNNRGELETVQALVVIQTSQHDIFRMTIGL